MPEVIQCSSAADHGEPSGAPKKKGREPWNGLTPERVLCFGRVTVLVASVKPSGKYSLALAWASVGN